MVMLIVGILAAIGTPSFKYVTTSNRISSEINGLLGDMQFARTEAIKEGQTVTICTSSAAVSYASCTGSNSWQLGWIVFLDSNGDQQVQPATEAILRVQPAFNGTDTLVSSVTYSATTFNRMGYAPTGQTSNITINLHDSTATPAWTRCLNITPIGYATTEQHGAGTPPCT